MASAGKRSETLPDNPQADVSLALWKGRFSLEARVRRLRCVFAFDRSGC